VSGPKNTSSRTFENIQSLRGIAAVLVLYAHVRMLMHLCNPAWSESQIGGIGVDLFFVISGFVISLTANKKHHTAGDFLLARFARVLPLYFVANLTHTFLRLAVPGFGDSHVSLKSLWNGFFFLPVFDTGLFTNPPIFVGWTLSFEMWFYLVFAASLLFVRPRWAACIIPPFFAVAALGGNLYHGDWILPHFLMHPFAIEFGFGCVVYQLRDQIRSYLPILLLAAAALYAFLFSRDSSYLGFPELELGTETTYSWLRVALWGVPVALLAAAMVGMEVSNGIVLPKPFVWLGAISYSLYVVHWPVIQIVYQLSKRAHLHSPWITAPFGALTCLAAGTLAYYCVERPLTMRAQSLVKRWSAARAGAEKS
jgi:exopolysaccharide production protein ExoZ